MKPDRPFPFVPPEIVPRPQPDRPGRPEAYPPVPTVWMPNDDVRTRIHEQLLERRTVFLDRALDAGTASLVVAQLMTLDGDDDHSRPVSLVVNSHGGPLPAASAVVDTIDLLRCPVDTVCLGQAIGTAAVVVAAGTGRRRAGASAQFRLRLPDVELAGDARRLSDEVAEHRRLHDATIDRLAAATGQERRLVERDLDRGRTLTAQEAHAYGLIDEVIQPPPTA